MRRTFLLRVIRSSHGLAQLVAWSSLCALGALACGGGKLEAKAGAEASTEGDANFDVEGDAAWDQVASGSADASGEPGAPTGAAPKSSTDRNAPKSTSASPALFGARHDLGLSRDVGAKCKCLAALAGPPATTGMSWRAEPPKIDESSQLVVALRSDGVSCDVSAPGATYMGYEKRAPHVFVQVEAVTPGRPVTQGAIIPKPDSGGRVIIEGVGGVPYGKSLDGKAGCTVFP